VATGACTGAAGAAIAAVVPAAIAKTTHAQNHPRKRCTSSG
jgi:hypothetical protein